MLQSALPALPDQPGQEGHDHEEQRCRHEEAEGGLVIGNGQGEVEQVDHLAEENSNLVLRKVIHEITS